MNRYEVNHWMELGAIDPDAAHNPYWRGYFDRHPAYIWWQVGTFLAGVGIALSNQAPFVPDFWGGILAGGALLALIGSAMGSKRFFPAVDPRVPLILATFSLVAFVVCSAVWLSHYQWELVGMALLIICLCFAAVQLWVRLFKEVTRLNTEVRVQQIKQMVEEDQVKLKEQRKQLPED